MMDKQELLNKIEEQQNQLEELKKQVVGMDKPSGRWKPNEDDTYWYISTEGDMRPETWLNDYLDNNSYAIGNVFRTREEAEFAVEKLKVIAELSEYACKFNRSDEQYYIYLDTNYNEIGIDWNTWKKQSNLYFKIKEIARQAIETVGEERIKKYYFGVSDNG